MPGTSFSSPLVAGAAAWVWTTRPDLDNTQLFEVMRRSAVDLGTPGFDNASGYGLLNIPNALAFRTPARDPQEPNEDPAQIEPHGLFAAGTQPLNGPGHLGGFLTAHLDRSEDPGRSLSRVGAGTSRPARAGRRGAVQGARAATRAANGEEMRPLAVAKGGAAAYRNTTAHGATSTWSCGRSARTVEYTLRLTVARR